MLRSTLIFIVLVTFTAVAILMISYETWSCSEGEDEGGAKGGTESRLNDRDFEVDAVIAWVDGTDPVWLKRKSDYMNADKMEGEAVHAD